MTSTSKSLEEKVKEWFDGEGYPIEFAAASSFRRSGFRVFQGYYVRDEDEVCREIDVLAHKTDLLEQQLLRVCHVVECKWTNDKPWVVFTSQDSRIHPSACIAQTIGTEMGSTVLWTLAHNAVLHNSSLFWTPERPGFNGHQAFSKDKDQFYSALKTVISQSTLLANEYTAAPSSEELPAAVADFPTVVINGRLYEAYFDESTQETVFSESTWLRCHWRGAPSWQLHATVDIVTLQGLDAFVKRRAGDVDQLLFQLRLRCHDLLECKKSGSLKALKLEQRGIGLASVPPLLHRLIDKKQTS